MSHDGIIGHHERSFSPTNCDHTLTIYQEKEKM